MSLSRRKFIQLSGAAPVGAALAKHAFAVPMAAGARGGAGALNDPGLVDAPSDLVILNINEFPAGPTPAAVEMMKRVVTNGNRYYLTETRKTTEAIASSVGVKPQYVTMYAGSSEPLTFSALAFTSPERSLVLADPTYEQAIGVAEKVTRAKVHRVPLKADYSYDIKAMVEADPNAGLIYICNPNNPTGTVVKRSDIEWVLANKPKGSVLLVDEAYTHFSTNTESVIDLVAADKEIMVLRTFSKIYAMGGIRAGYIVARPDMMEKIHAYGVNMMPTAAVQCARIQLQDKDVIPLRRQMIADARNDTFAFLGKHGYTFTPSESNHFMVKVGRPGGDVHNALAQKNIIIGRTWKVWPEWVRVSVGSVQDMKSFQTAFVDVMQQSPSAHVGLVHPYPEYARMAEQMC